MKVLLTNDTQFDNLESDLSGDWQECVCCLDRDTGLCPGQELTQNSKVLLSSEGHVISNMSGLLLEYSI